MSYIKRTSHTYPKNCPVRTVQQKLEVYQIDQEIGGRYVEVEDAFPRDTVITFRNGYQLHQTEGPMEELSAIKNGRSTPLSNCRIHRTSKEAIELESADSSLRIDKNGDIHLSVGNSRFRISDGRVAGIYSPPGFASPRLEDVEPMQGKVGKNGILQLTNVFTKQESFLPTPFPLKDILRQPKPFRT